MVNFIIVLSVLVLFHELGHYLAARYFGVTVESFAIGIGPRVLGVKWNGTDFKFCLLPFGGYVKMAGSSMVGTPTGDPGELLAKPRWQRLIIASMGPIFNFGLAIALLVGLHMHSFQRPEYFTKEPLLYYVERGSDADKAGLQAGDLIRSVAGQATPTWLDLSFASVSAIFREVPIVFEREGVERESLITLSADPELRTPPDPGWHPHGTVWLGSVSNGSVAANAGLLGGDTILSVNGQRVVTVKHTADLINASKGEEVSILVLRHDDSRTEYKVRPQLDEPSGTWRIGVALRLYHPFINIPLPFWDAVDRSLEDNIGFAGLILRTLKGLIVGQFSVKTIEGPVGIYRHTQNAADQGLEAVIMLMAIISVNLGIVNLMPIPVLDGGHIMLLLIEILLRREVSEVARERIMLAGMLFIFLLFAVVMYNDVSRALFER